jgi:hypothetical protein
MAPFPIFSAYRQESRFQSSTVRYTFFRIGGSGSASSIFRSGILLFNIKKCILEACESSKLDEMVAVTGLYKSKLSKIKESMLRISERSASLRYGTHHSRISELVVIKRIISIWHIVFVRRRMETVGWGRGEAGRLVFLGWGVTAYVRREH